ncbi:hypothetical protein HCN44_002408 [Aphidius gifuensis]|uniref:Peroxisomal leader peptide-processing protease n=1 Tax=Aphidius gifuensis TaxID=684658 RepID=A0A834Y319_APHGI|nr:peroxisomal leader peptide-processing protease [Aphidius gifuensis]KAF7996762.1 hypothetical protein HCN44_002408 [Aphidius gifuensis]
MDPTSVSISFSEGSASEIQGTSGIKIAHNIILTNGILLKSKLHKNNNLLEFIKNIKPNELLNITNDDLRVRIMSPIKNLQSNNNINEKIGEIIYTWRCPLLADTIDTLFNSWKFSEKYNSIDKILLSCFLIISIDIPQDIQKINVNYINSCLNNLLSTCLMIDQPNKGDNILIESTPFGNPVFIDSISCGIASNILGIQQCLVLTDATAVPGCEGGPVYVIKNKKNFFFGIVIAPMSWCRGEWVEYTLVACLTICLSTILNYKKKDIIQKKFIDNKDIQLSEILDKNVVLIRCGAEWGSGILLDKKTGTILTCSHVVSQAPEQRIKVVLHDDKTIIKKNIWAKLIYRTPNGLPYDIAVLNIDSSVIDPTLRSLTIANDNAKKGETVIAAGFPFFSSTLPTITRGNISSVSINMIQTTCCVQSGASGGPIVRPSTGELLGIIVCNVITSTTLYPKLNMAIPASIIKGPIDEYINTGCVKALESLTSQEISTEKAWNFHLPSKI